MNDDIRAEIKGAGLKLWQVAEAMGMFDSNFSKKLRHEMSDTDKARVRAAIVELKEGGVANAS